MSIFKKFIIPFVFIIIWVIIKMLAHYYYIDNVERLGVISNIIFIPTLIGFITLLLISNSNLKFINLLNLILIRAIIYPIFVFIFIIIYYKSINPYYIENKTKYKIEYELNNVDKMELSIEEKLSKKNNILKNSESFNSIFLPLSFLALIFYTLIISVITTTMVTLLKKIKPIS